MITLINTGMRVGELLNLKFADIDFNRQRITAKSNKTNNFRVIPINQTLHYTLAYLKDNYIDPKTLDIVPRQDNQKEYVFCLPNGNQINSIKHSFNRCCQKVGIKTTPHVLRHSFASYLVMNGVDLVSVKELLGHTQISTTMMYSHLSPSYKQQTVERLPWIQTQPKLELVK